MPTMSCMFFFASDGCMMFTLVFFQVMAGHERKHAVVLETAGPWRIYKICWGFFFCHTNTGWVIINGMIDGIPMGCLPPINGIYTWDDHGNHSLVGGDWNMTFIFPNSWDDDPIWRTPSFFRGVGQPPTSKYISESSLFYHSHRIGWWENLHRKALAYIWW